MDGNDDDISEYLDPELDSAIASTDDGHWLGGGFGLAHLVILVHVFAAGAMLPSAWLSFEAGNHLRAGATAALAVLVLVAGVAFARFVATEY